MSRQAIAYRKGRVLLAGDAAHVHSPVGGQGLNTGVQDAMNLGWKLAQVVKGTSPDSLLDTYHLERHPVAARVLRTTMAQIALQRPDDRTEAMREIVLEFLAIDEPRKRIAAETSGLGIHYNPCGYDPAGLGRNSIGSDGSSPGSSSPGSPSPASPSPANPSPANPDLGNAHPLLGRRMPDLDLITTHGALRVNSLLHTARPVLIDFAGSFNFNIAPWTDRVQLIEAKYPGTWELPAIGTVAAPDAVLVRPDGYVAWVGMGTQADPTAALTTWFGPRNIFRS